MNNIIDLISDNNYKISINIVLLLHIRSIQSIIRTDLSDTI